MKVIVTGAAGFIGSHVARELLLQGAVVIGLDCLGSYYDVALKQRRIARLQELPGFEFVRADFAEPELCAELFARFRADYVVHLGAQPGVRYSIERPALYTQSNLVGFANVLEACRRTPPLHLVYASSSSVYGTGATAPFREDDDTDQPMSFYAATKKANEMMAHSYAVTHGLRITGLRFFTVYGPWGRPDMAPTLFAQAICAGRPLRLFNHGKNLRDFTYIDDIVAGILGVMRSNAESRPEVTGASLFNLGHNRPVETLLFVRMLEELLGRRAELELVGPQPGDMFETCADLTRVRAATGYMPRVPLEEGLHRFVAWFRDYYAVAIPQCLEKNVSPLVIAKDEGPLRVGRDR